MKLILLLQRKSWFIEHGGNWSPLSGADATELALTALPLVCVDEYDLAEQPLQHGHAEITSSSDSAVQVKIVSADGSVAHEETITLDQTCLSHTAWDLPPEDDGWIRSVARLETENVRQLVLKAYIPPIDQSDGKPLTVRDESTGQEKTLYLRRGQENELVVLDSPEPSDTTLVISCDAEAANDSADVRSLGFVLLDKVIGI
ncbi:MAG: hypothetical protein KTR32_31250 [Granulosicoccus sp.]|nr:hypothetical protein [Granulosicoccus sp.]